LPPEKPPSEPAPKHPPARRSHLRASARSSDGPREARQGSGETTGRRRENGVQQRKNAHGSIAGQRASRDQRRMSRVSKRSAGYRELANDAGREFPSEHLEGLHAPAQDEPSSQDANPAPAALVRQKWMTPSRFRRAQAETPCHHKTRGIENIE